MRRVLTSLLWSLLSVTPLVAEDPAVLAKDPEVVNIFVDVLMAGGIGFLNTEGAAFVLHDESGAYRCVPWPFTNRYHGQTFVGSMPRLTVAIAHTHPSHDPKPSDHDGRTAAHFGVIVFVLTHSDIYAVTPDGRVTAIVVNHNWTRNARPSGRCGKAATLRASGNH